MIKIKNIKDITETGKTKAVGWLDNSFISIKQVIRYAKQNKLKIYCCYDNRNWLMDLKSERKCHFYIYDFDMLEKMLEIYSDKINHILPTKPIEYTLVDIRRILYVFLV